jgi:hypothetical protein
MKSTVQILGIDLRGKKIVLMARPGDAVEKVDVPSSLETYLGRPVESSFDRWTYLEYHSWYSIADHPTSLDVDPDVCDPVHFPNVRKALVPCIINSVHPRYDELFVLRLLFRRFLARTLDELQTVNDEIC